MPPDTVVRRELSVMTDAVAPESTLSATGGVAGTVKLLDVTRPKGEVTFTVIAVPPAQGAPLVE